MEKFSFQIENEVMVIEVGYINGCWESKVISGKSGTGNISGGRYKDIEEFKKSIIRSHTYSYYFFNRGYKAAKQSIL